METWFEINRKETRARIHDDNNVGHNDKQDKQMEAHGLRKSVVHLDTGGTSSSGTRRDRKVSKVTIDSSHADINQNIQSYVSCLYLKRSETCIVQFQQFSLAIQDEPFFAHFPFTFSKFVQQVKHYKVWTLVVTNNFFYIELFYSL